MYHPGHGIRLRSSARTDTGRVRDNNEDNVHLWAHGAHIVLAIVADGMGGAVAGEEASRIAVETIQAELTDAGVLDPDAYNEMDQQSLVDHMRDAILRANNNIVDQSTAQPELKGMGTTITMSVIRNTHVVIGHVGDSRAYLVDGFEQHIIQLTADHTFVRALVDAGHITEDEAEDHPMGNVLYRALGQAYDVDIDFYHRQLRVGDSLVLCSDGLTLHVRPYEISQICLKYPDPAQGTAELINLANSRGGRDNISAIIIKVEQDGLPDDEQATEALYMDRTPNLRKTQAMPIQTPVPTNQSHNHDTSSYHPTLPETEKQKTPKRITSEVMLLTPLPVNFDNESTDSSELYREGRDPLIP